MPFCICRLIESAKVGTDSCHKFGNRGHAIDNMLWLGMRVTHAVGACKWRGLEYVRKNRIVMARGDDSQMSDEVRRLKRSLDAEDTADRKGSGEEAAA